MSICLTMIVKNEEKIIERLLSSVISFLDTYCICDTGSTDNTISIIKRFFFKKKMKGKILSKKFINFEYNRNYVLTQSKGMSDFILLLDADMIFYNYSFRKEDLKKNYYYQIYQGTEKFHYLNTRIIPNNINGIKYIGYTHEYITIPSFIEKKIIPMTELFIYDVGDGGSKEHKIKRDIELLKLAIKEKNNIPRNTFYLANSYYDKKEYNNAIEYYIKRTKLYHWSEEIWFSYYRIGKIYLLFQKKEKAVNAFLQAITYNPTRIENIYEIIKLYRLSNQPIIAMSFYKMAISMIKQDSYSECLFFYNDIYHYLLDYEYCIIAYYNNIFNINNTMISIMNKTEEYHSSLIKNLKFYITNLIPKNIKTFTDNIEKEYNGKKYLFYSSSSSFISFENKYILSIRYVNYSILKSGEYQFTNLISIYKMIEFDKNFEILSTYWIEPKEFHSFYSGIDDIRLFPYQDKIHIIGNINNCEVQTGLLKENEFLYKKMYSNFPLQPCEKNWVFTLYKNKLCIIYGWDPFTLCSFEKNKIQKIFEKKLPTYLNDTRGSSCGFLYENEIWFIIHKVDTSEELRYYYHSILVFDIDYHLLRYTPYFKFKKEPIEYTLSIFIEKDTIIIPISSMDKTTELFFYDKSEIERFFYQDKN